MAAEPHENAWLTAALAVAVAGATEIMRSKHIAVALVGALVVSVGVFLAARSAWQESRLPAEGANAERVVDRSGCAESNPPTTREATATTRNGAPTVASVPSRTSRRAKDRPLLERGVTRRKLESAQTGEPAEATAHPASGMAALVKAHIVKVDDAAGAGDMGARNPADGRPVVPGNLNVLMTGPRGAMARQARSER